MFWSERERREGRGREEREREFICLAIGRRKGRSGGMGRQNFSMPSQSDPSKSGPIGEKRDIIGKNV